MSTPDPELLRLAREWMEKEWMKKHVWEYPKPEEILAAFASSPEVREYLDWKNLSRPLDEL